MLDRFFRSLKYLHGPAIWKQEYAGNDSTQTLYYLHRDHLGSIVLITDTAGDAVERRLFDAWAM